MKASVTFREEKSPLIRMKFPVTLAGFPLASGFVLGDNQDLALHVGTSPEACPSVKIAYQPNLPSSPLSLIVKAGIGPWGPPHAASLSVSAEFRFSRISSGPFFTVHIKPRLGDFSFRKMAKPAGLCLSADACKATEAGSSHGQSRSRSRCHRQSHSSSHHSSLEAGHTPHVSDSRSLPGIFDDTDAENKDIPGSSSGLFGDAPTVTPLQLDKSSLFTPMPFRGQSFHKMHSGILEEAESVDTWGTDYVKIEDFDHSNRRIHEDDLGLSSRRRSHDERAPNFDNFKDHQSGLESPLSASGGGGSCLNEQETASVSKAIKPFSVPWCLGVDESIRGWSLHAHSSLPLGAQTALKIRWGVNAHPDLLQGWESHLSSVKLPYLYLQKISLVTTGIAMESSKPGGFSKVDQLQALAQDEEIYELSPVAALCGSMKRQLQLLYAENQVLKKAMEEMKTQFEQRSSGKPRRLAETIGDVLVEDQIGTSTKLLDHASEGKGGSKERKDTFTKNQHEKGGTVSDKSKRNHAHEGLDALKKFGGLGRGGNGKSSAHHSMLD
eukprot:c21035_g2_i1 orf=119-1774(-)